MESFQNRVKSWLKTCFGHKIAKDKRERNHRFLEEALELVQACGCSREESHLLVDYVYDRPAGDKNQEAGGVMVTLAALCLAQNLDMEKAGETELARVWTKVDTIRQKQASKPENSPLPMAHDFVEKFDILTSDITTDKAFISLQNTLRHHGVEMHPDDIRGLAQDILVIGKQALKNK
jgi:hypothetical protein